MTYNCPHPSHQPPITYNLFNSCSISLFLLLNWSPEARDHDTANLLRSRAWESRLGGPGRCNRGSNSQKMADSKDNPPRPIERRHYSPRFLWTLPTNSSNGSLPFKNTLWRSGSGIKPSWGFQLPISRIRNLPSGFPSLGGILQVLENAGLLDSWLETPILQPNEARGLMRRGLTALRGKQSSNYSKDWTTRLYGLSRRKTVTIKMRWGL